MPPDLESLARARFPDRPLSQAEERLVRAAPKGDFAFCGPSPSTYDPANDPSMAESWGTERQISAELIRWLCVDRHAKELVDPRGIQVDAAKILGFLDLFYVTVPFPLTLSYCSLNGELNLRCADLLGINLQGTWLDSIAADGAQVKNNIFLRNGFHASGQVRLPAARIGGNLECDGGRFENPARLDAPESGLALIADGAIVNGAVFLRNGFSAVGEVRLLGAQIGGCLDCTNTTFKNPLQNQAGRAGISLNADSMRVKGSVLLNRGFHAEGEVSLAGSQIDGDLNCNNATFSNSASGNALTADRVVVKGCVFLGYGFRANGEVRLLGAQIGGNLDCDGGKFKARPGEAGYAISRSLSAHSAVVEGNVFLRDGFQAEGEVGFTGAQIAGNMECTAGAFHGELILQTASIKGALFWRNIVDPERLRLDLTSASVGVLADNSEGWPQPGNLLLDGLVYERFSGGAPKDAKRRLDWLARQKSFASQPYRQLAKVLRDEGRDTGAQQVLYKMECRRRTEERRSRTAPPPGPGARRTVALLRYRVGNLLTPIWNVFIRGIIGYGYYPVWALWWLLGLAALGLLLFWSGFNAGSIAPTDKDAYSEFKTNHHPPPYYQRFHASVYSLENSLPLVKLGQAELWQPDPDPEGPLHVVGTWKTRFVRLITSPVFLRRFLWFQILLGWILATFFAAGITGIVRKD